MPQSPAKDQNGRGDQHETASAPPLCRYFLSRGSCLRDPAVGGSCRFSHVLPDGKTLEEVRKETVCPFIGRCRYGDRCMFSHDDDDSSKTHKDDTRKPAAEKKKEKKNEEEEEGQEGEPCCGVCLEVPLVSNAPSEWARFALLPGCDHAFCVSCLKQWRAANKSKNSNGTSGSNSYRPDDDNKALVKCCPTCRAPSRFCVPSDKFYTGKKKDRVIKAFVEKKAKKPCSQYHGPGTCPFGSECFYAHFDSDGNDVKDQDESADVLFQRREEEYQQRARRRRRRRLGITSDEDEMALVRGFMSLLTMFGEDDGDGDWTEVDPVAAALALEAMGIPVPMPLPGASVVGRVGLGPIPFPEESTASGPGRRRRRRRQRNNRQGGDGHTPDEEEEEDDEDGDGTWLVNVD